jgi:hypothetical protein
LIARAYAVSLVSATSTPPSGRPDVGIIFSSPHRTNTLCLLKFSDGSELWTSDDLGDSWVSRGDHPLSARGQTLTGTFPNYQVFWMLFREAYSADSASELWKPPVY